MGDTVGRKITRLLLTGVKDLMVDFVFLLISSNAKEIWGLNLNVK